MAVSLWLKSLCGRAMRHFGVKSPVLFPIVGGLKDNTYYFKGEKYTLPRHGFAR
ncbi:MAG: hypothetical protein HC817_12845, partial [Saprospiraceae bacterium]|nr:hypothetical protein [Saprospiraceae bacterium]